LIDNISVPEIRIEFAKLYTGDIEMSSGSLFKRGGNIAIRELLAANRTYYVRTDGSDGNDGLANTSGGAFLTIQKAVDTVASIDIATFDVTIQVGDGTYTGAVTVNGPWVGSGTVTIKGNASTPANVLLSTTSASTVTCKNGGRIALQDLELRTTTSGDCIASINNAYVSVSNVRFGTCAANHVRARDGGVFEAIGNYTISGSAAIHWGTFFSAMIRAAGFTITLSGTPAFSTSFAQAGNCGGMLVSINTFSGAATGKRYDVVNNGVINTGGGGATYLPGDTAGTTATGGQYV